MANEIRTYRLRETVRAFQFDPDEPLPEGVSLERTEVGGYLLWSREGFSQVHARRGDYAVLLADRTLDVWSGDEFERGHAPVPAVAPSDNPDCVCSFCPNTAQESRIVEGGRGKPNICAECVALCNEVLSEPARKPQNDWSLAGTAAGNVYAGAVWTGPAADVVKACPPDCDHKHNPNCALSCYEDTPVPERVAVADDGDKTVARCVCGGSIGAIGTSAQRLAVVRGFAANHAECEDAPRWQLMSKWVAAQDVDEAIRKAAAGTDGSMVGLGEES